MRNVYGKFNFQSECDDSDIFNDVTWNVIQKTGGDGCSLCSKDEQSLHRGIYFGKVLLSFYGGVAVSFLATQILDLKASWIGILPTVSAFLLCNVEYGRCKVKKEDILKASA